MSPKFYASFKDGPWDGETREFKDEVFEDLPNAFRVDPWSENPGAYLFKYVADQTLTYVWFALGEPSSLKAPPMSQTITGLPVTGDPSVNDFYPEDFQSPGSKGPY